jgi:pyrroline-5-carboxylate reductase
LSLLMIGCGKMGGALLDRWITETQHKITIVDPALKAAPANVILKQSIEGLEDNKFDIIVIAIKPQLIEIVLPAYRDHIAENGCIVSIAAGYSVTSIEKLIGLEPIIRIMPNLPAQIGRGVSALYVNAHCTDAHAEKARVLTDAAGYTLMVDSEDALDKVTAVAGSGPGYAFEIARCWMNAAQELGFSAQQSRELVLNTLAGSIEMALHSDQSMDELRDSVTSKAGTTEAGLKALNNDGQLTELLNTTLVAAYNRAIELR